jgi:nucleoid-associated protein YgaU
MGVFDFIKDTGSKILKGSREEKLEAAREAATAAKSKARQSADSGNLAAKAREAQKRAKEAAAEAREKAAEQAQQAKEKAAELQEAAEKKRAEAREAFLERRAEANKADELEEYLQGLGMGKDVDVRFDDGVVYLSGTVSDQAELERVVLAVGNVEGVERVDEDLDIDEPTEAAARMYTVKSGDTLSAIAKQFYGDANRYTEIFEANRPMLTDPNMIYPGQVLRIP